MFAALLAVLAMSAIGAASASASECPGTGEGVVLCSGGHVLEGTFAFTGSKKASTGAKFNVVGIVSLQCEGQTSKGQLVATKTHVEMTNLVIERPGCKLEGHATCKVKPLVFGISPGLKGVLSSTSEISLSPMTGELFSEVSITQCEQEYSAKVTGQQKCKLAKSTAEAVTHEEVCASSESRLKAGTRIVELEFTEEIKLSSGQSFSLQRS
ncbi:MAG TPA: hypothetical protein VGG98_06495 [Solirubrobacteraceae bacterium]|jgi:hypothetical protein